jgi:hypothetical protein
MGEKRIEDVKFAEITFILNVSSRDEIPVWWSCRAPALLIPSFLDVLHPTLSPLNLYALWA